MTATTGTSLTGPAGSSSRSSGGVGRHVAGERGPLHHESFPISSSTTNAASSTTTRQTIDGVVSLSHGHGLSHVQPLFNINSNGGGSSSSFSVSNNRIKNTTGKEVISSTGASIGTSTITTSAAAATTIGGDVFASNSGGAGGYMISRPDSYSVHSQLSGSATGAGGGGDWPEWPTLSSQPVPQQQQQSYQQSYQALPHLHSSPPSPAAGSGDNVDPDDQEQALFEQRLCEDIYGVAVRKINQNGKSNLRYVKCSYFDESDFLLNLPSSVGNNNNSSSRSVSSRNSRSGLARFLSGASSVTGGRSVDRNSQPHRHDQEHNKTPSTKIRALTWGKKNLVKIPVDKFVVVRKGKTTDRTKRNPCPSSRILSLITNDPIHQSLDIEAPTRLDRDKFARAFARFLRIPLEGDATSAPAASSSSSPIGGQNRTFISTAAAAGYASTAVPLPNAPSDMRSVRSELTHQSSLKDQRRSGGGAYGPNSVANSSVPDAAMTTTNSFTTNNSGSRRLANGSTSTGAVGTNGSRPPYSSNTLLRTNKLKKSSITSDQHSFLPPPSSSSHHRNLTGSDPHDDIPDPQLSSFPSSSNHDEMGFPKVGVTKAKPMNLPQPSDQASGSVQIIAQDEDDASVVSSITGGGFDQDLVEELHLALEKMRSELQESRAEAARAVKVAEQAIQSAENSSSKDWNSTVTHKAAEAAAAAQKKSAEAMAKARVAEEKLEIERKNAAMWKKQVEAAEEQAGHWQTRAAAAEVQRFAVAEALESERKRNSQLAAALSSDGKEQKQNAFDPFDSFHSSTPVPSPKEEIDRLRSRLAMESARRRKLLGELQDLRGSVRVYCRLSAAPKSSTIALASSEVLMLRQRASIDAFNIDSIEAAQGVGATPLSFEFDGILTSDMEQQDVYAEFESVCASVVEGFRISIMTFGASNSCKSQTMLGDVVYSKNDKVSIQNHGIQLLAMKQLFSLLEHRRERYQDIVTMTLIEVHDEKLIDLVAGTDYGDSRGRVEGARRSSNRRRIESEDGNASQHANSISSSRTKLEIKTNRDGETVVHGVVSVEVSSFEDFCTVWSESLSGRSKQLLEQDIDLQTYQSGSHVIANLKVVSRNVGTGVATTGRLQFVDFAAADTVIVPSRTTSSTSPPSNSHAENFEKWKYVNKSLNTLDEVVKARNSYQHSVPYRNSTITHLIRDSLEADTKTIMIACVNPDEKEVRNTTCSLRFAQEMRKVVVGKATRHTCVPTSF